MDWEQILVDDGNDLDAAYQRAAADALYQDRPREVPSHPVDPGSEAMRLPFDEA